MLYALITPQNTINRIDGSIDPTVQTKAGWKWLPVIDVPRPSYNTATHVEDGISYDVQTYQVLKSIIIREKTESELQNESNTKIDQIDSGVLAALLVLHNEILISKGEPPITLEQYREYIKGLV